jgi:hypothetical protein
MVWKLACFNQFVGLLPSAGCTRNIVAVLAARTGIVMTSDIRLVIADVDGTLVTQEKVLIHRAIAAFILGQRFADKAS